MKITDYRIGDKIRVKLSNESNSKVAIITALRKGCTFPVETIDKKTKKPGLLRIEEIIEIIN